MTKIQPKKSEGLHCENARESAELQRPHFGYKPLNLLSTGGSGEASNSTLPSLKSRAYLALNPSLNPTAKSSEGFLAVAS